MMNHLKKAVVLFFMCLSGFHALAQVDSHYWTNQYGSKGLLLNGAVIASPDGETSSYYNPGAIGMDDDLGFLFSFITPTYFDLNTENILGDGNSIRDRSISFAPGFFGLRLRPFKNKKITIAISNFERYDSNIRLEDRVVSKIAGSPDLLYRVDLDLYRKVSEDWRGIGLAYNLNENIGIGLSQFSVWHSQRFLLDITSEINSINPLGSLRQFNRQEVNYKFNLNSAFVTKLGFSYKSEKVCFGMTYTSPLYGAIDKRGSYSIEDQVIDTVNDISSSSSNRNNTTSITYRSPHSFGMGLDYHTAGTSISISSEYFLGINKYTILDENDDSFDGMTGMPNETTLLVNNENKSVLNFAVGIQREITEKTSLVFGFRSDLNQQSTLGINEIPGYRGVVGDVYHFSGGSMINFKNNEFSCGFDFGFGKRSGNKQIVDIAAVNPDTFPDLNGKQNVSSRFNSFMIFITYDFIFKRFKKDEQ